MKRYAILLAGLALVHLAPAQAEAQVNFGPYVAWGDNADLGIGGRVDVGLGNAFGVDSGPFQNLFLNSGVTYFFIDCDEGGFDEIDCSWIEINGNLAVPFTLGGSSLQPYAGTGIHIARVSFDYSDNPLVDDVDDTEVGLNILGGVFFPISDLRGFGELKFELGGGEQFVLSAGILF
jgi:opacity protein-like surface antigen